MTQPLSTKLCNTKTHKTMFSSFQSLHPHTWAQILTGRLLGCNHV